MSLFYFQKKKVCKNIENYRKNQQNSLLVPPSGTSCIAAGCSYHGRTIIYFEEVEEETSSKLLNIGSCALHTLHNAYEEGVVKSFNLGGYLAFLHWLFKDSPARREDFTLDTGSAFFPQSYCGRRWLELVRCMDRALNFRRK